MDYCLTAFIVVIVLFIIYAVMRNRASYCAGARAWPARSQRSGFYTESAIESPTRPYGVPYTGTEPRGTWGSAPWGATAMAMLPTLCE